MSFLARTEVISDGTTDTVQLTFPYLQQAHVGFFLQTDPDTSSLLVPYTGTVTYLSETNVQINPVPASGQKIIAKRETPRDDLLARLTSPGTIQAGEINYIATQLLYLIQEALDAGLGLEALDLTGLLTDLRYTYDFAFFINDLLFTNDTGAAHSFVRRVQLPANAADSQFNVIEAPTSQDHIISVRRNGVEIGTVTVASAAGNAITVATAETTFEVGDEMTLVTTQDGGMRTFNGTFRMFRLN